MPNGLDPSTFCVLPWYSREIGSEGQSTVCCWIDDRVPYDLDALRKDLYEGKKTSYCQRCWDLEKSCVPSRRQQSNQFLKDLIDVDVETASTRLYQIFTSNVCNAACTTCSGGYSSKWRELNKSTITKYQFDIEQADIDWATALKIDILGGEPLYDKTTWKILDRLTQAGNLDCRVSIVTNGSVALSEDQKKKLQQFKNLGMCISIDGCSDVYEYLRWPLSWTALQDNIKDYKTVSSNVNANITVSALNAVYYAEITEWLAESGLPYSVNPVTWPRHFSLDAMPVEIKQYLRQQKNLQQLSWSKITGSEIDKETLIGELDRQDLLKQTDWKNSLRLLFDILQ